MIGLGAIEFSKIFSSDTQLSADLRDNFRRDGQRESAISDQNRSSVKNVPNGRIQGLDPGAAFARGYGVPRKSGRFRLKRNRK